MSQQQVFGPLLLLVMCASPIVVAAEPEVPPLAAWGKQMREKEGDLPPKVRREVEKFRKQVTRKLKGNEETWYAIVLNETTWSRSSNDTAKGVVAVIDMVLLPVTILTGGFSKEVPDASMSRFDTVEVVLVKGQETAADLVTGYALDLELSPKQPNVVRNRSYAVLKSGKDKEVVVKAKNAIDAKIAAADPHFAMRKSFERDRAAVEERMKGMLEGRGFGDLLGRLKELEGKVKEE